MPDIHERLRLLWISGSSVCFLFALAIHYTQPNSWLPIEIVATTLLVTGLTFLNGVQRL